MVGERNEEWQEFLNLEKQHALPNQFRNLLSCEEDVTDKNKIYQELGRFNKNLFIGK